MFLRRGWRSHQRRAALFVRAGRQGRFRQLPKALSARRPGWRRAAGPLLGRDDIGNRLNERRFHRVAAASRPLRHRAHLGRTDHVRAVRVDYSFINGEEISLRLSSGTISPPSCPSPRGDGAYLPA
jgi:hypothetical protein